jgi:hypothetical protein
MRTSFDLAKFEDFILQDADPAKRVTHKIGDIALLFHGIACAAKRRLFAAMRAPL